MSTNPGSTERYRLQTPLRKYEAIEVWKALDTQTRRPVTVTLVRASSRANPDFATRFQRTVPVLAALRHPNIVPYNDFSLAPSPGTETLTASLVGEYVDGGLLTDYLHATAHQGQFPPVASIIRLFLAIGSALDYAHQQGVVHGQLTPDGILLAKNNTARHPIGEPLVTDFGLLRLLGGPAEKSGRVLRYTSPEQLAGAPEGTRSDIYALGILLYEICTGTTPFPGDDEATLLSQQAAAPPVSPALKNPALPKPLVTIILRSLAKNPALRFPDVASMMEALRQGLEPREIPGRSQTAADDDAQFPTMLKSGPVPVPGAVPPSSVSHPGVSDPDFATVVSTSGSGRSGAGPLSSPGSHDADATVVSNSGSGRSGAGPISTGSPGGPITPIFTNSPGGPMTPMPAFANGPSYPQTAVSPAGPMQTGPRFAAVAPQPALPVPQQPRRRGIVFSVLLVLIVIGAGLGVALTYFRLGPPPTLARDIVGHAYFVSSGLLSADPTSNQGITDQLEVKLENISAPQTGKNYYTWLLNAKNLDWKPIFLGTLHPQQGTYSLDYAGTTANLLAGNSRLLVTEEDAAVQPINPSLDPATWRYYAEFSQIQHPFGTATASVYDHVRHLLSDDPKVKAANLSGGLDIWLYRNTQKILEWAGSARDVSLQTDLSQDQGQKDFLRRQLRRMMVYLDGTVYAQNDLQGNLLGVNPPTLAIGRIGLLTLDPAAPVPGYLHHIDNHLHEIALLPEASPQQKTLAIQINQALNEVSAWDTQVRKDVLAVLQMDDTQLAGDQARSLLDEAATLANFAFVGQVDPQGQMKDGVVQIHYAIQNMATFDVRSCTTSKPCPALT